MEHLLANGKLRLLPAKDYDQFDSNELRLFCHHKARYGLPTEELVTFLRELIGRDKAIEIGAGSGDLGYHLRIPMTDSYCQDEPDVRAYYKAIRQPTIEYGQDVEKIEALAAVEKYKPDVVVGCWVTQWIDPCLPPPSGGGSIYGIKEDELIKKVKKYILVGSEAIHGGKFIMSYPHTKYFVPGVRSRRSDNRIWVWERS